MEALRAEHLDKRYGAGETEVWALRDIGLVLHAGEIVALLGPSGAGKSTLIKVLGLVTPADRGDLWMNGERVLEDGAPVADVGELRRSHLGFVFQKANLIPFLSARQNVEIACEIGERFSPRARADELLEYLGVGHRGDAFPNTLSGGEQQRVAIARALANAPSLILADEPTAALDKERGRTVMELLRRVAHEQGTAVMVVTHDHRSLDVFDATYEMEDGRLSSPPRAP
ncbi:MAG: ABC transporter ATP-binding protein [Myxococcales bacterium]|nr:ABC transporter ATP-binding protein [Myxococcales bacterium]